MLGVGVVRLHHICLTPMWRPLTRVPMMSPWFSILSKLHLRPSLSIGSWSLLQWTEMQIQCFNDDYEIYKDCVFNAYFK